jgi:glyoxylase-like metal-dependent hydrolase (beta-lactamase superfamily II)
MTDTAAWRGGDVGSFAHCVLAANPGPMTLEGTNTWVLSAPGSDQAVVVDPGPDDVRHRAATLTAVAARGARVAAILLTHGHADHSEGARALFQACGAPVRALDPAHTLGAEGLVAGGTVATAGLRLDVVATPGHTGDSLSFVLREAGAVLTGDTVLGRGTTVVAHPDGRLADYLTSLDVLSALALGLSLAAVLPGHGPVLADPAAVVAGYRAHRLQRLDEVRAAVASGTDEVDDVVAQVYADVDRALWPAAALSVQAQLAYLRESD